VIATLVAISYARARGEAERVIALDKGHWERQSSRFYLFGIGSLRSPIWEFTYDTADYFAVGPVYFRYTLTGQPIPPTPTESSIRR